MIYHYAEWNYVECRNFFSFQLNVIILSVVMLNVIMLSVIVLSVVMLNVIMLSVIVLSVVMLNVIMLSVIVLSVVMLNAIMLSVIVLSVVMLNVIMLNVVAPSLWSYFTNIRPGWKWLLVSVIDAGQVAIGNLVLAVVNGITGNFLRLG